MIYIISWTIGVISGAVPSNDWVEEVLDAVHIVVSHVWITYHIPVGIPRISCIIEVQWQRHIFVWQYWTCKFKYQSVIVRCLEDITLTIIQIICRYILPTAFTILRTDCPVIVANHKLAITLNILTLDIKWEGQEMPHSLMLWEYYAQRIHG